MTVIEKNSLILAPMAGVTDYVYRGLCARFGAEATVTEMVSAKGYLLTPKERLDVIQLRQTNPGEHCALQIFGSDADSATSSGGSGFAKAAFLRWTSTWAVLRPRSSPAGTAARCSRT